MALKGTLKDFSIADIFQLISQQQKSGSLYITNDKEVCHIMFDKGMTVIARFKQGNDDLMIGNMLLRAGIIKEDQLQEALEDQQTTFRSIGDILLSMHFITADILAEFILLQIKEVLFRLLQWKDGLYEFLSEEFKYNKNIIKSQRAEQLLLDGFRMQDEWPAVISKISSLDSVYKPLIDVQSVMQKKEPSFDQELDQAFEEYDENKPAKKEEKDEYTEEEIRVLPFIDGVQTIKEIIDLSRLGTFNTAAAVASLIGKGAVIKIDLTSVRMDADVVFKPVFVSRKLKLYRTITDFIVLGLTIFILPSLIFHFSSNIMSQNKVKEGFYIVEDSDLVEEYIKNNELEQIMFALEIHKLIKYAYPVSLKELVTAGLLPSNVIENKYFQKTGNTYILLP